MSTEETKPVKSKTIRAKVARALELELVDRRIAGFRGIPRCEIKNELVFVDHKPYRVSAAHDSDLLDEKDGDDLVVEEVTKFIC